MLVLFKMAHDFHTVSLYICVGENTINVVLYLICHHILVTTFYCSNLVKFRFPIALNLLVHLVLILGLRCVIV